MDLYLHCQDDLKLIDFATSLTSNLESRKAAKPANRERGFKAAATRKARG